MTITDQLATSVHLEITHQLTDHLSYSSNFNIN